MKYRLALVLIISDHFSSGELSSISGSDSDTDSDLTLESIQRSKCQPEETSVTKNRLTGRQHPKVLFVNEDGDVLSVYRSVLCSVKVMIQCSLVLGFHVKGRGEGGRGSHSSLLFVICEPMEMQSLWTDLMCLDWSGAFFS